MIAPVEEETTYTDNGLRRVPRLPRREQKARDSMVSSESEREQIQLIPAYLFSFYPDPMTQMASASGSREFFNTSAICLCPCWENLHE